jgi:CheY-like chemotaxis protein
VSTILVVEDDPIARNFMVQVLTGQGLRVFEADTAAEALTVCSALKDQALDLVIADHVLPNTTVRNLAERILEFCPHVKIIHVSAFTFSRMEQENELVPGSSFLQKPFTGDQLINLVQQTLNPRKQ